MPEHLKPLPEEFEYPWSAANLEGAPCRCVHCGKEGHATFQIQAYPHRWIPTDWRLAANKSVACFDCASYGDSGDGRPSPLWGAVPYHDFQHYDVAIGQNAYGDKGITLHVTPWQAPVDIVSPMVTEEEEVRMYEDDDHTDAPTKKPSKLKKQAKATGKAVGLGVAMAAVDEGGDIMLDIAKTAAKNNPMIAALLEDEDGREVAKFLVALGLQTAATHTSIIPKGEFVARVAEMQLAVSSFKLIGPRLKSVRKYLVALAKIGENLDEDTVHMLTAGNDADTLNVEETTKKRANGKRAAAVK